MQLMDQLQREFADSQHLQRDFDAREGLASAVAYAPNPCRMLTCRLRLCVCRLCIEFDPDIVWILPHEQAN
jgi:hypothetical protein